MFLKDYRQSMMSLENAQFMIALVLDDLGAYKAAKMVFSFNGTNTACNEQEVPMIKASIENVANAYHESSEDPVHFLLHYFSENRVLTERKYSQGRVQRSAPVLFGEVTSCDIEKVYNEVMKMYYTTNRDKLIVRYMKSHNFRTEFAVYLRRFIGNTPGKLRGNRLSDSTIEEELSAFQDFVDKRCSDGQYKFSSGTPESYLLHSGVNGSGGPFLWFRSERDSDASNEHNTYTRYDNILNKVGLNSTLSSGSGDGSVSIIDKYSVATKKAEVPINFISVCDRIYRASRLLFMHNRKETINYDIFTYHRDLVLQPKIKDFKQRVRLLGINFTFTNDDTEEINAGGTTYSHKMKNRLKLCDVFEEVLSRGIRREEVFSKLYAQLHTVTSNTTEKDGALLFSFDGRNAKITESNGQILQELLDGYMALRDFLLFLESGSNKTGVTMNSFQTDIFRDRNRLNRVHSFEEYVDYNSEISELCNQVANDPARSAVMVDSVMSNDYIYGVLSGEKLLKSDAVLQSLRSTPLAVIGSIVEKMNCGDADAALRKDIVEVSSLWERSLEGAYKCQEQFRFYYEKKDYEKLEMLLAMMGIQINKLDPDSQDISIFAYIAMYAKLLKKLYEIEGNPVVDSDGVYLLENENCLKDIGIADTEIINLVGVKNASVFIQSRVVALRKAMHVLWGEPLSNDVFTWRNYRSFWFTTELLEMFFSSYSELIVGTFQNFKDDLYLMLAKSAGYSKFFELSQNISSVQELAILLEKNVPLYVTKDTGDIKKYLQEEAVKEERGLICFRRLFENLTEFFSLLDTVQSRVDVTYKELNGPIKYDRELEVELSKASASIQAAPRTEDVMRVSQKLQSFAKFDELGYVTVVGNRYSSETVKEGYQTYYHKDGYIVQINEVLKKTDIEKMSEQEMLGLECRIEFETKR